MKFFAKRPLEVMFLQNSLVALAPIVIYLLIIGLLIINFPILDKVGNYAVSSIEELEQVEEYGFNNISMNIKKATYSGYDYYENNNRVGSYYYTIIDGKGLLVLIKGRQPLDILENYRLKGKIINNNPSLEYIITQFSKDTGLEYSEIDNIIYSGIISEIDYPYVYNFLVYFMVLFPAIITILAVIANFVFMYYPHTHPQARQLLAFGTSKEEVINELNSQIRNRMVSKTKHSIITEEYIIIHNWITTNVIKIDYIKYISKHVNSTKLFKNRNKMVYKLTMSNPEKMFYEYDFYELEEIDTIIEQLIILCPNLDDEVISNWIE